MPQCLYCDKEDKPSAFLLILMNGNDFNINLHRECALKFAQDVIQGVIDVG